MKLNMTLPRSAKQTFLENLIKFYPDTPGEAQNLDVSVSTLTLAQKS